MAWQFFSATISTFDGTIVETTSKTSSDPQAAENQRGKPNRNPEPALSAPEEGSGSLLGLDVQASAVAALGAAALAAPWFVTARLRSRPRHDEVERRNDRIAAVRERGMVSHRTAPGPTDAPSAANRPTMTPLQSENPQSSRSIRPVPDPAPRRPIPAPFTGFKPDFERKPANAVRRPPPPFSGRAWVVDGDTIVVAKERIRLFGIDAPELDQRGGTQAKSALIRLCRKKRVTIEPLTFDCYNRIVAKVWLGDIDLSERMVRDGFAVATSRWNRDYLPAEREARTSHRGLWQDCQESGITDPEAHRAARRREEVGDPPDRTPRRPWLT